MIRKQDALDYHSRGRRGKIEITPTKPTATQRDLALAYSPGVAEPCLEIDKNPEDAFNYTTKGNLVGVVSNGSAVLGLGNIGPLAAKPVMEGKGVLFKRFADIDVFDIELDATDPDDLIRVVKALEPTFGGINLEDIKAPDCFYIEEALREELEIPVFHDDQHGTAIISAAALLNWLDICEDKSIDEIRLVVNGAGAAGIACAELVVSLGLSRENILMCDSKGVIYRGRTEGLNPYKERFAVDTRARTLEDAMGGADVFMGVSVKDAVTQKMVANMNDKPLIMAMANPDPEIGYDEAMSVRDDLIMATGRSDFPNQVNNVLGFPFIFRGALDVRARSINMEMKIAAVKALAGLAKEDVPDSVMKAYGVDRMQFGRDYIIPTPFDPRVLTWEAPAVAEAAMESGVARTEVDIEAYREQLDARMGRRREVMRSVVGKAKRSLKRIVFPEGEEDKILRASQRLIDEQIAAPILLARQEVVTARSRDLGLELEGATVLDPRDSAESDAYAEELYGLRSRRGVTRNEARELMANHNIYGSMMVNRGDADAMVAGLTQHYPDTIRPALQIVQIRDGVSRVAGVYMMVFKNDIKFFADTTVVINPTAEELCDIALETSELARRFDIEPRVAMLSFSNFGSSRHPEAERVRRATELIRERDPDLIVDGEMQADTAVVDDILKETYPFSRLDKAANVLIFPNLSAGNIAYKLMQRLGGAEAIGPILVGLRKPVHVLQRGAEVSEIVNVAAIAAVDAQNG